MNNPKGAKTCAQLAYEGRFDELPNPMTADEAAAVARRSRATITRACHSGVLKGVSYGGKWNVNRDALLEYAGLKKGAPMEAELNRGSQALKTEESGRRNRVYDALKLKSVRFAVERDYVPSRERDLAITKLEEAELWLTHCTLSETVVSE